MTLQTTTMDTADARKITEEIKTALEMAWDLVVEACTRRAWAALGYPSWDAYCSREFHTERLRLPRSERAEVVAAFAAAGMSVREIAAATGASKSAVGRDLSGAVPNGTPPHRRPAADEVWALFLSGRNPGLSFAITDQEWAQFIDEARAERDDAEAMAVYASVTDEVFEVAVTLCATIGDLSRERLVSVLLAAKGED